MSSQVNLQDKILNIVRKKNITVTVYLTNGFQLKGKVVGFDNFTVILNNNNNNKLIYKHAISTIEPEERVEGFFSNK